MGHYIVGTPVYNDQGDTHLHFHHHKAQVLLLPLHLFGDDEHAAWDAFKVYISVGNYNIKEETKLVLIDVGDDGVTTVINAMNVKPPCELTPISTEELRLEE